LCGDGIAGDVLRIHNPERVEFRVGISDGCSNEIFTLNIEFFDFRWCE